MPPGHSPFSWGGIKPAEARSAAGPPLTQPDTEHECTGRQRSLRAEDPPGLEHYRSAISATWKGRAQRSDSEFGTSMGTLYSNLSASLLRLQHFPEATVAKTAIEHFRCPKPNAKAFYRLAKAHQAQRNFAEASRIVQAGLSAIVADDPARTTEAACKSACSHCQPRPDSRGPRA